MNISEVEPIIAALDDSPLCVDVSSKRVLPLWEAAGGGPSTIRRRFEISNDGITGLLDFAVFDGSREVEQTSVITLSIHASNLQGSHRRLSVAFVLSERLKTSEVTFQMDGGPELESTVLRRVLDTTVIEHRKDDLKIDNITIGFALFPTLSMIRQLAELPAGATIDDLIKIFAPPEEQIDITF